jgi:hypothetical protein
LVRHGSAPLLRRIQDGFRAAGKPLRMGKAGLHFADADDLALDVIGEIVAAIPLVRWVEIAKSVRSR